MDEFAAYLSDVAAIEDDLFKQQQESNDGVDFSRFWSTADAELREIQEKHGLAADDPRVTSIAQYDKEMREVRKRFSGRRAKNRKEFAAQLDEKQFYWNCLAARFFPLWHDNLLMHGEGALSSTPTCWYFVQRLLEIGPQLVQSHFEKLYGSLIGLKLPFGRNPPYPVFTPNEARAELIRIAIELENEDERRCQESLRADGQTIPADATEENRSTKRKSKKSTEKRGAWEVIIAALSKHHQYAEGGCLNLEPIRNNELARAAGVAPSTASEFFKEAFKDHKSYRVVCQNGGRLVDSLKALRNEFAPHELYGRSPKKEDDRYDDLDGDE